MTALTPRQQEAFGFIRDYIGERGYSPSFDELRTGLGFASKNSVHRILSCLEDRGAIRRKHNRARAIEIPATQFTAEHHLRAILDAVQKRGVIFRDSPAINAAKQFLSERV